MKVLKTKQFKAIKFNLEAQDQFVKSRSVTFEHWAAIPSPIGMKDSGEYRRSDVSDTLTSNGFLYKKVGEFNATLLGNGHKNDDIDGGIFDNSTARITMPRFYNARKPSNKKEISLLPGDRIYAKGIELKVDNYQRTDFEHNTLVDVLQFPVQSVSMLIDSQNKTYSEGQDFTIKDGNIHWSKQSNPGIDTDLGKGKVYGIRYTYLAFWYVASLINEIRITTDENDNPARMPYQAMIQREYVYNNKNKTSQTNHMSQNEDERTNKGKKSKLSSGDYEVSVEVSNFK